MQLARKNKKINETNVDKRSASCSTAELSDLVLYQQELTGARAKIIGAAITHTFALQPEKFSQVFIFSVFKAGVSNLVT